MKQAIYYKVKGLTGIFGWINTHACLEGCVVCERLDKYGFLVTHIVRHEMEVFNE
jgi:hypothetical protein